MRTPTELRLEIVKTKSDIAKTTSYCRKRDLQKHIAKLVKELRNIEKLERNYCGFDNLGLEK